MDSLFIIYTLNDQKNITRWIRVNLLLLNEGRLKSGNVKYFIPGDIFVQVYGEQQGQVIQTIDLN